MRKGENPFEPGAGTKPRELFGREIILEDAEAAVIKGLNGRSIRGQIYYGLRGVGKTVLLREISEMAARHGALVADLETPEDKNLAHLLVPAVRKLLIEMSATEKAKALARDAANALQAFAAQFKIKIGDAGVEVRAPTGLADSGDIENDVTDLLVATARVAKQQGKLIFIAIDEMQYLDVDELSALITALHKINQSSLPLCVFGAGLPQLLGIAGNAKSYSERLFEFVEIGALIPEDARRAIRKPINDANAEIEDAAVDYILGKSQGYPYFLQEWGYRAWYTAERSPIRHSDTVAAELRTIQALDKSFFRVRFDRLSTTEQTYLRAMAELGPGPHKSGDVARIMGKKNNQVGPVRAQVIAKGMAYGGQYGMVHFSVPLFDEFMKRAMPIFEPKHETR
jgi:AAA ATPase domain